MHIIVSDDYQDCVRYLNCFAKLVGYSVQIYNDTAENLPALISRFVKADALVLTRERTAIGADLLERLPNLRLISQTGPVGAHIDLAACTHHGVAVTDGSGDSVPTAELTWALILASRRHVVTEANRLRNGLWQGHLGMRLRGQRLGIWGYGRIGKQVAAYGKAFGMDVCIWGSAASRSQASADGHKAAASRDDFFSESDVLSLHLRLTPETHGIVTRRDLQRMKQTALLVNTSRAQLIEPQALELATSQGRPGFAAVDVFENEPVLGAKHPLLTLPNVLATPHIGFVERENYEQYYGTAFDNITRYLAGDFSVVLNPDVLTHPRQRPVSVGAGC